MSLISKITTTRIFTTPRELRMAADLMEKEMPKVKWGDTVPKHIIVDGRDIVELTACQDTYNNKKELWV